VLNSWQWVTFFSRPVLLSPGRLSWRKLKIPFPLFLDALFLSGDDKFIPLPRPEVGVALPYFRPFFPPLLILSFSSRDRRRRGRLNLPPP